MQYKKILTIFFSFEIISIFKIMDVGILNIFTLFLVFYQIEIERKKVIRMKNKKK
jgi:hypothetical protein